MSRLIVLYCGITCDPYTSSSAHQRRSAFSEGTRSTGIVPVLNVYPLFVFLCSCFALHIVLLPLLRARVIDAAKAKAIQGSAGAPSEGEKDAHELLRTLVCKGEKKAKRAKPIELRTK